MITKPMTIVVIVDICLRSGHWTRLSSAHDERRKVRRRPFSFGGFAAAAALGCDLAGSGFSFVVRLISCAASSEAAALTVPSSVGGAPAAPPFAGVPDCAAPALAELASCRALRCLAFWRLRATGDYLVSLC